MNPKELNIGNLVYPSKEDKFNIYYVESVKLRMEGGKKDATISGKPAHFYGKMIAGININPYPILLNEDWFKEFGFTKSIRNNDWFKDLNARTVLYYRDANPNQVDLMQDGKIISLKSGSIKYVHQLQNFYYSWMGEEIIKP